MVTITIKNYHGNSVHDTTSYKYVYTMMFMYVFCKLVGTKWALFLWHYEMRERERERGDKNILSSLTTWCEIGWSMLRSSSLSSYMWYGNDVVMMM